MSARPTPLRIGIAPVVMDGYKQNDEKFYLVLRKPKELQQSLVTALRKVDAAAEIVAVPDAPGSGEMGQDNDLVLQPRLESADFAYTGTSNGAPLSGILWFVSWFGGLLIEDCSYASKLTMEFDVFDPKLDGNAMSPIRLSTTETSLSFFERNEAFNAGFWQSLLIPPFWTSDNAETTSASITDAALLQMAAKLKGFLRGPMLQALDDDRFLEIDFIEPRMGQRVRDKIDLRADIKSKVGVGSILVRRNGVVLAEGDFASVSDIPSRSEQGGSGSYSFTYRMNGIKLKAGENRLQLWIFLSGGASVTRTIVVNNRGRGADE